MAQFEKLERILRKELQQQEKLLEVLAKERAAIAKMNREDVESLTVDKGGVIANARSLENEREAIVAELSSEAGADKPLTFDELVGHCRELQLKKALQAIAKELKQTAVTVKQLNDHNAMLIKQTLGTIVSTIAIFRSAADSDLPRYGSGGALVEGNAKSPAPRSGQVREA